MSGPTSRPELLAWLPPLQRDPGLNASARRDAYAARLAELGTRALLWAYEPEAEATLAHLQQRCGLSLYPVVPNMRAYLRDASDFGVAGAVAQRVRRLTPLAQLRLALRYVPRLREVLARDFVTGLLVLVETELARLQRYRPAAVLLTASVTDLALALGNTRLLAEFLRRIDRGAGLPAGLATYNFGVLAGRIGPASIRPAMIVAPFNPRGYLMNPSREACEAALHAVPAEVIASHLDVDGYVDHPAAFAYLRQTGLRRGIVELAA
jgi:hypothetical protein